MRVGVFGFGNWRCVCFCGGGWNESVGLGYFWSLVVGLELDVVMGFGGCCGFGGYGFLLSDFVLNGLGMGWFYV